MPSTYVAGVDSSTQSCKVTVHELATGEVVRTGRASHPPGTEVAPEAWWSALQHAIVDAGGLDDVAAISIAAQQHGLVALDAQGHVVRDALLWNDVRSADAAAALVAEVGAQEYARRVGVVPVASFTGAKLRWLRDHEPANAARVAAVALPHDWLSWRLRGYGPVGASALGPALDALATDRSDASGTAYWSASTGAYDLDLLERAFGRVPILPRVLGPAERMGVMPGGTAVGAGLGDNAGGALGLGARPGDAMISIGTSGTVFAVADRPLADPTGTVAGFADGSGNHLPLVATLNAARVLDTVAGLLGVDHDALALLALAAEPGADGLVLQPYFEGERTPNRPDATATLFGMSLASTRRETLARAAVEGLLCGLADGLDAIRRCGVPATRILLIGGAARNPAVSQIAAQVFDVPIVVPGIDEAVARGAAVQAAWALTDERPSWADGEARSFAVDHRPIIREQYAAHV
ncbi:xylulokinase [Microbacterium sp. STF-2]|uniref:xylulokinase n=1 Tax=Microbacterium sp. STF-2 TaxID=3031132 RepID=UPI002AFF08FF|nr:xylulokinase [Microbacterium sp. STF-2]MEA1263475.1 xylulokinase [Microbacterium sp. STF-2]